MIVVNAPDGSTVTFADGTSESTINQVMEQHFAPQAENSLAGSAKAAGAGLAEGQLGHLADVGFIFCHPVTPGYAGVQIAVFNVAADFLGSQQANLQFGVIDRRTIGALGS